MTRKLLLIAGAALLATPLAAQDARTGIRAGDVLLRARVIGVLPQDKSSGITPAFPAETVKVDNAWTGEVDVTYMATNHIGFELIAATTKHHVAGRTGTTGSIGELASTWVLPPTLTAQYHFMPTGRVRPYVGAGLNLTLFYNEKASRGLTTAVGSTDVRLSSSVGPALQAGVDIDLGRNLFANLDVKWIDIDTNARLTTTAAGVQRVRVNIDPVVVGIGFGTRF